jgi:hypothetical protein
LWIEGWCMMAALEASKTALVLLVLLMPLLG